jgi:hypothetical protein
MTNKKTKHMRFKIKHITDHSIIEIISMNIDNENNILVLEDNELGVLSIGEFKDMILGTSKNKDRPNDEVKSATHKLAD